MNKIIILSYLFPPDLRVGGKRMYQFSKFLPSFGWTPVVVTSPIPSPELCDFSFDTQKIEIRRIYGPKWWAKNRLLNNQKKIIAQDKNPRKLIKKIFNIPLGKEILLAPFIVPRLVKICKQEKIRLIYATCGPPATLLHAYITSRLTGIPLLIDFRDPWSLNYLQKNKSMWIRYIEKKAEGLFIKYASKILFSSVSTCARYQNLFGETIASKMLSVYSGYDPAFLQTENHFSVFQFTIIHFGNCFGNRSLKPVMQALKEICEENLLKKEEIKLICLGTLQSSDTIYALENALNEVIISREVQNYSRGMADLMQADLLLLLGYGEEVGFIPAKTFDYLLVQKPILCITECKELEEIIKENQGYTASQKDIASIKSILHASFCHKRTKHRSNAHHPCPPKKYDVTNSVKLLAQIFNSIDSS